MEALDCRPDVVGLERREGMVSRKRIMEEELESLRRQMRSHSTGYPEKSLITG